jgi:hypothetical protein
VLNRTLGRSLLGEKNVTRKKERKEEKIIPKIVVTTFFCNAQGQPKYLILPAYKIMQIWSQEDNLITRLLEQARLSRATLKISFRISFAFSLVNRTSV